MKGNCARSLETGRLGFSFGTLLAVTLTLLLLALPANATAQTARLSGYQAPLGNVVLPAAVAVDAYGNVYVTDVGLGTVYKETPSGDSYIQSTVVSGLNNVSGVAVDKNGNVYIAEPIQEGSGSDYQVLKETPLAGGGYTRTVIASCDADTNPNCFDPAGVAVDSNGNVYWADYAYSYVYKETPSGTGYTQSVVVSYTGLTTTGVTNPIGLAVDSNGNLFIADTGYSRIAKMTPSMSGYTLSTAVSIGGPSEHPEWVAVDANDDLYVSVDGAAVSVVKETLSGGSYTESTVQTDALNFPQGVAVDGSGNVYIADRDDARVLKETLSPSGGSFGLVDAGTTAPQSISVFFTFDSGGTLGSLAALTQGATGLDFAPAGSPGTCTAGTDYQAGDTCTVDVSFTPKFAGTRYGAVELLDGSGNVLATGYVQGTGVGPQVNFLPGTQSTVAGGLSSPGGVAVDASGNAYIANTGSGSVLKETFSSGSYTRSTLGAGLLAPAGVAVDGAGDIYVADYAGNAVYQETLTAGSYTQSTVPTSSLSGPSGVAVDGGGDVYIVDSGNARVLRETLSAGSYSESVVASTTAGGLEKPSGVAVDGRGGVYITDGGLNQVLKETLSAGSYTQSVVASSGLSNPTGIAVDGNGNVYFVDGGNTRVLEETPSGSGYTESTVPASGLAKPLGVAVDGDGNVYIGDGGTNLVLKEDFYDPPSLTFPTTDLGATSSTQTVTLVNEGNVALNFTGLSYPADFSAASGDSNACTGSTSLNAGQECDVPIEFTPAHAGSLSEGVTLTDNDLNVSGAQQSIMVSGTGTTVAAMLTSPAPGSTFAGPTITFIWTPANGATGYYLRLGSTGVGSGNVWVSGVQTGTSVNAAGLPTNGETIYARLFTYKGSAQTYIDYTYTAATQAALISPAPGSTLADSKVTFTWSAAAPGATGYSLLLGSTGVGSYNLFTAIGTTATSVTPSISLPVNGETIYARLYTNFSGVQTHADYTYTAATQAALTSPAPGSTLPGPSVTFSWTAATGAATGYYLRLGSTGVGSGNVWVSGVQTGTSVNAAGLPTNGETIYARLITYYGSVTTYADYTYTAAAQAALTTPAPGSTLAGPSVTFSWTAATGTATGYSLYLGSTGVGSFNLYESALTTATSLPIINLPVNGETIYARLITSYSGVLTHADYTYTAATQAAMISPAPGSTLAGSKVTFTWSAAAPGATGYSLLLGSTGVGSYNLFTAIGTTATSVTPSISLPVNGETIYARLYTNFNGVQTHADYTYTAATQSALTSPAPGSTLTGPSVTFSWTTIPGVTGYSLYLGSTGVGSANLYESALTTATSIPITNLPVNGETVYARLTTSYNGVLSHADYTYTAATQAAMTSPAPGSTFAGPTVTFTWSAAAPGATGYSLWLGSTGVGSYNLFTAIGTTATSVTPGISLPTNGETIYARLYTNFNGVQTHADYTYTAAP